MSHVQELIPGATYTVIHARKGTFTARLESVGAEWAHMRIVSGGTQAMVHGNEHEAGEEITVRKTLATFTRLEMPK